MDAQTRSLVRFSARITAGSELDVREGLAECMHVEVGDRWIEEVVLQSYLFAGFPRALNAAREWRRAERSRKTPSGELHASTSAALPGLSYAQAYDWRLGGEETCAIVYGASYERLRTNIRALHPELDEWMIVEGYGKVLSRPGLDLARRELCIVAACAAAGQERQLHSHLHGAVNAGASAETISAVLDALAGVVQPGELARAVALWKRVGAHSSGS